MSNHHQISIIRSAMPTTQKAIVRIVLKPILTAIVGLTMVSAATIRPAHAFNVMYNFTVQIDQDVDETQGLTKGTTEQGSFTYDNSALTGIGSEYASPSAGNLMLTFNFLNTIYTEKSDLNYGSKLYKPDYPAAFFTDGKLIGLDFLVVPSQFQPPNNAPGFRLYKNAFYIGATDNTPEKSGTLAGTVTYCDAAVLSEPPPPSSGVAAVPEPSEVGGAIVASLLGVWAMRRVKGQKH